MTKYHWINLFNMNEGESGFDSVELAKAHAVAWFNVCQGGMALHVGVGDDNGPICEGSIKDGVWIDGAPTLTTSQQAVGESYRRMLREKTDE